MYWIFSDKNRSNCENVFHKIFDQAKNECEKYDAPLLIPRRCKSQIFGDNYPSDDPEHLFREAIFVPYLDHLIVEMEDRFFDQKQKCRSLWGLIPKFCDASPNTAQDLETLLEIYQEDIDPRAAVVPEVQRWLNKWKRKMLALFLQVPSMHSVLAMLTFIRMSTYCSPF